MCGCGAARNVCSTLISSIPRIWKWWKNLLRKFIFLWIISHLQFSFFLQFFASSEHIITYAHSPYYTRCNNFLRQGSIRFELESGQYSWARTHTLKRWWLWKKKKKLQTPNNVANYIRFCRLLLLTWIMSTEMAAVVNSYAAWRLYCGMNK